jgi:uncharacterized protein YndB with AHSA1/START domain
MRNADLAERIVGEDGRVSLVFRRRLGHAPERVWRSLTDPAEWQAWHFGKVRIVGGLGGMIEADMDGGFAWRGDIVVWEPPRLLAYEMIALPQDHPHGGERSFVRYEISPAPGGSLLVLRHTRLMPVTAQTFGPGSHAFLDRLEAWLDGARLPDWAARYAELGPHYR